MTTCVICNAPISDYPLHCACGTTYPAAGAAQLKINYLLSRNNLQELQAAVQSHGLLIADVVLEIAAAIGRPYPGPVAHAQWMQRYRQWFRDRFKSGAAA